MGKKLSSAVTLPRSSRCSESTAVPIATGNYYCTNWEYSHSDDYRPHRSLSRLQLPAHLQVLCLDHLARALEVPHEVPNSTA